MPNRGHPGLPLGIADVATILFSHFLKFHPAAPHWPDRDRFRALGGAWLDAALCPAPSDRLSGHDAGGAEAFPQSRQPRSRPSRIRPPAGIETTTGPLGQEHRQCRGHGLASGELLNARFEDGLVDHKTYVIASDGDLEEGVSHEAINLAGHYKLKNLILLWDDNAITIDGATSPGRLQQPGCPLQGGGLDHRLRVMAMTRPTFSALSPRRRTPMRR